MPLSDEEAYRQGKRIAADMIRGSYNPTKDYSSNHSSPADVSGDVSPQAAIFGCLILSAILGGIVWLLWKFVF